MYACMYLRLYKLTCIYVYCYCICFNTIVPPVIDDSTSTADVPIEVNENGNSVTLELNCSIKKSSPSPTIMWLHNGIPINLDDFNPSLVFSTEQIHSAATSYEYILRITSNNGTYQFVYDNVIGMYQCIASNEAGHVIVNRRVLFKCKLNAVYNHVQYVYVRCML